MNAPRKKSSDDGAQIMLFADVLPNGHGGYTVTPRPPQAEVTSAEAARMLNVCRSSMSNIIDRPLGQKHLRWRWLTEGKGKRVFTTESVLAYREALRALD